MAAGTTKDDRWTKVFPDLKPLNNPSIEALRALSMRDVVPTDTGAPALFTHHASAPGAGDVFLTGEGVRPGLFQRMIDPALDDAAIARLRAAMPMVQWMSLDRRLGQGDASFHCRLLIPQAYPRVALLWAQLLFPAEEPLRDPLREPDFLTLCFPNWLDGTASSDGRLPERLTIIQPEAGITFVLGTDDSGEARMSFLRQAMYRTKRFGGLGVHAGSKVVHILKGNDVEARGVLLLGLSGAGKTALTLDNHGLNSPEGVSVLQDDVVLMLPGGRAHGTESNFYVRTEGVTEESQPGLYRVLMSPETIFGNAGMEPPGKGRFLDNGRSPAGRALAIRAKLPHAAESIDLNRVHKLIFLTRRDTIVPPVARLSKEAAAAFFMLGESIDTSAGDLARPGLPQHVVGFNPFILGPEEEEGNRLYEILKANQEMEVYLLNTGSVGKGADAKGFNSNGTKILKEVSSKIVAFIARQEPGRTAGWMRDKDWGYEVPRSVPGVTLWNIYNPLKHYTRQTFTSLTQELRKERRAWLSQFKGLAPDILKAI